MSVVEKCKRRVALHYQKCCFPWRFRPEVETNPTWTSFYLRVASNALLIASILLILGAIDRSPASAQTNNSEAELEQIASEIAVAAVQSNEFGWPLFWFSTEFPLRISFEAGTSISASSCGKKWHQEYREYIQFINEKEKLVKSVPVAEKYINASIFVGTKRDPEYSRAKQLYAEWAERTGVVEVGERYDQTGSWALEMLGRDGRLLFSAFDLYMYVENAEAAECYPQLPLGGFLSEMLVPGFDLDIAREMRRRDADAIDQRMLQRVVRRLLSAIRRLPANGIESAEAQTQILDFLKNP